MALTPEEQRVLAEVRANPFLAQAELAERLGLPVDDVRALVGRLQEAGEILGRAYVLPQSDAVCCIGGMNMDRVVRLAAPGQLGTSNPARSTSTRGGVARNVAENLVRLRVPARIISIVGDDPAGHALIAETKALGVDASQVSVISGATTGSYTAIMQPSGELWSGIAETEICDALIPFMLAARWSHIASAGMVFAEANLPAETLARLVEKSRDYGLRLALDTVSVAKARRLPDDLTGCEVVFCNRDEAAAMVDGDPDTRCAVLAGAVKARGPRTVVLSHGAEGVWCARSGGVTHLPVPACGIVDVSAPAMR